MKKILFYVTISLFGFVTLAFLAFFVGDVWASSPKKKINNYAEVGFCFEDDSAKKCDPESGRFSNVIKSNVLSLINLSK